MTRKAEWIPICDLKPGDWIADPHCGQPGRVNSVDIGAESVIVSYRKCPPGRLGFRAPLTDTVAKLVRTQQKAARK
jgi:hypothetical protein